GQTRYEIVRNRVPRHREDNRDYRCRLLRRNDIRGSRRDNHIDLKPDKVGGDLGEALATSLPPCVLDRNGAALDPSKFAQPFQEGGKPLGLDHRRALPQEADGRQFGRLLRARRKWPRRGASEQRDELAPSYHSITSSARASTESGTLIPSVFAVLRLMTSSNLVDCITGRSAGLIPFRIRPA